MILGIVGATLSAHFVVRVNTPVHWPIVIYPVIVRAYHELLCAIAFT